ncbi:MAG: hypothetical protein H5T59_05180 [Anaerolineae bacterium]|nr:hypothetical protein [Anaerolineae bacterium]
MTSPKQRIRNLFTTTEGLLLVVTGWEALAVAFLSLFSGPMAAWGVPARLGLALDPAGRVGRIIMLYHALAVPLVAALVYLMLDALPFDARTPRLVRPAITVGYMLASGGAIAFAYFGAGWIAHGLFLVGLSLVFYAGAVLAWGLFPWRPDLEDGFTWERLAFWLMAVYTLASAVIGGAAGAYFGNGFTAFLAEDVLRDAHNLGHRAIIAHLHIMLTLMDVALLLLVARRFRLQGRAYRVAMPLTIVGTTIVTFATWSVMFAEEIAHKVINVGSAFLLPGALIVAFWGFAQLAREGAGRGRLRAVLRDPIRFGLCLELVFVNVVVTVPGVYVAFYLETYRQPAYREVERAFAVGHWHVLATLSAVVALFLVADRLRARGALRQVLGWGVLAGSTLAFVFIQFYLFRAPGQDRAWTVPFFEAGIAVFLVALAAWLGERLWRVLAR